MMISWIIHALSPQIVISPQIVQSAYLRMWFH